MSVYSILKLKLLFTLEQCLMRIQFDILYLVLQNNYLFTKKEKEITKNK